MNYKGRLLSAVLFMLPVAASAEYTWNQGSWATDWNGTDSIVVSSGNSMAFDRSSGASFTGRLFVGQDYTSGSGDLYLATATSSPFYIVTQGDLSFGGTLDNSAGRTLYIDSDATGGFVDVSFGGGINNAGALYFGDANYATLGYGINDFMQGTSDADTIQNSGTIQIYANNNVSMNNISQAGGTMTISAGNAISAGFLFIDELSTLNITAASFSASMLQNSGNTSIETTGDIIISNYINNGGNMTLTANNLIVNGATSNSIFDGNFTADITGATTFANGAEWIGRGSSTFSLSTGTLVLGGGPLILDNFFTNNAASYELLVRNGSITAGNVNNLASSGSMTLSGTSVTADSIYNQGIELNVTATDATSGTINVSGAVSNNSGSGAIELAGNTIALGSITNWATMNFLALTNTGSVSVTGSVTNSIYASNLNIESRQVSIGGSLIANGGTTNVIASDNATGNVSANDINVAGGILNMDAYLGVSVADVLTVSSGALNFGTKTTNMTSGNDITISGNLTASGASFSSGGNVNVAATGSNIFTMKSTAGDMLISGNVLATQNDFARTIILDAATIDVGGNVTAGGLGKLVFGAGNTNDVNVTGNIQSQSGGWTEFNAANITALNITNNGTMVASGATSNITAANSINILGGVWFDGTLASSSPAGFFINGPTTLAMSANDIDIAGGISIGSGNSLNLDSTGTIDVDGVLDIAGVLDITAGNTAQFTNGDVTVTGSLSVDAVNGITFDSASTITNSGTTTLSANNPTLGSAIPLSAGNIANSGTMALNGDFITLNAVSQTAGSMTITGDSRYSNALHMYNFVIDGGYANITNFGGIHVNSEFSTTGNFYQGSTATNGIGVLGVSNYVALNSGSMTIDGTFNATSLTGDYTITNTMTIGGLTTVNSGATVNIVAGDFIGNGLANNGTLSINSDSVAIAGTATNNGTATVIGDDVSFAALTNNGVMDIDSGTLLVLQIDSLANNGKLTLSGIGLDLNSGLNIAGGLYQNTAAISDGDVNIVASDYAINSNGNMTISGDLFQISGKMTVASTALNIGENIIATDLWVDGSGLVGGMNVSVGGDITGGTKFINVAEMTVGGDYYFGDDNILHAFVDTKVNAPQYWATVSLNETDGTLGQITNPAGGKALITIDGKFVTDITGDSFMLPPAPNVLQSGSFGINLTDIVDPGTTIWFIHANELQVDGLKNRNLVVQFCNADASICFNYFNVGEFQGGGDGGSVNEEDLPAYVSERDSDGDGYADSLYIVFDPRFGGPVEVFKIQPLVEVDQTHTYGEWATAGALDNLIAGGMNKNGFYFRTPIEAVPIIFENTSFETIGNEIYNRMEQYLLDRDPNQLTRFSRLFQPRELEQIAAQFQINDYMYSRNMERRHLDEFAWNRHREQRKVWLDADFGMYDMFDTEDRKISGDRFAVHGGVDWAANNRTILGLSARASMTSGTDSEFIDLTYIANEPIEGHVSLDVATTAVGFGGYLQYIIDETKRIYGNAFFDMHMIDVSREQTYAGEIDGSGTAYSLTAEFGLMHDLLNQYIVGNIYARTGYMSGFDISETFGNADYMHLMSDGFMMLRPGYSVTLQKRIYTSPWFQVRPNAYISAEYELLGMSNDMQFRFGPASEYTGYEINVDPLWMNAGGGFEFLSANGSQFGIDYRYVHNAEIQMHKVRLGGSIRF